MAKNLLLSYTVLDKDYQNAALRYLKGTAAGGGNLDIDNPQDSGVLLGETADPVLFSFAYNGKVRFLVAKITTTAGTIPSSNCVYSLLEVPDSPQDDWSLLAEDITLKYGGSMVATNPHGVAHAGDFLYIIDYDSQSIYQLGADELRGKSKGSDYTLPDEPVNVGAIPKVLPPDGTARGQAIIALPDGDVTYLYALYIVNNADGKGYQFSVLVKFLVGSSGALTYVGRVQVGMNAQAIIPMKTSAKKVSLLIPAIGGDQQGGQTNGEESTVHNIPAFTGFSDEEYPDPILVGDEASGAPTNYDFHMAAASFRENGVAYLLTGYYNSQAFSGFDWRLFRTSADALAGITETMSISEAVTDEKLADIDHDTGSKGYFWDILLESAGSAANERLWFLRGSPIHVTLAATYVPPPMPLDPSRTDVKYYPAGTDSGEIGGQNINSADLTAETVRQAQEGRSLKRGLRGTAPKARAKAASKAAKAAKAAARGVQIEEEEGGAAKSAQ